VTGKCDGVEIRFLNDTGVAILIPTDGHTSENPGSFAEGRKPFSLPRSLYLDPGEAAETDVDLTTRCTRDHRFRIKYVTLGSGADDFIEEFDNVNIEDEDAGTLTLTES